MATVSKYSKLSNAIASSVTTEAEEAAIEEMLVHLVFRKLELQTEAMSAKLEIFHADQ